jgi:hypothetical protein
MVGLATVMFVVGIVAIANADEARFYTFQWRAVIAAFVVVTCVWAVASAAGPHVPRAARSVALVLVVVVIVWGTVGLGEKVRTVADYTGLERSGPALGEVMGQLRRAGLATRREILVLPVGTDRNSLLDGVVNELDRAGVDARVSRTKGRVYGDQRTAGRAQADEIWSVTSQGAYIPELLRQPGARLLARTTPLSPAKEAEAVRLQDQLLDELERAGRSEMRSWLDSSLVAALLQPVPGIDRRAAVRLAFLNDRVEQLGGCRCAVVAMPTHH